MLMINSAEIKKIPINRIYLDENNPRFEGVDSQGEAIANLCREEQILELAADIVENGLNHIVNFAVTSDVTDGDNPTYIARDGNRRICALKLLSDPELVPSSIPKSSLLKKKFHNLSGEWDPIIEINCSIYSDEETLKFALDRIHTGQAGGIGQKSWTAFQQARHVKEDGNYYAAYLFLLWVKSHQIQKCVVARKQITTIQRFFNNADFKNAIGLNFKVNELVETKDVSIIKLLAQHFLNDLLKPGKSFSRKNSKDISEYSKELIKIVSSQSEVSGSLTPHAGIPGSKEVTDNEKQDANTTGATATAEGGATTDDGGSVNSGPTKPKTPSFNKLPHSAQIENNLNKLGNAKLISLYFSLTTINLNKHPVLIAVGIWCLFEIIARGLGCNDKTSFSSFFSKNNLTNYGFSSSEIRNLNNALNKISSYGNDSKHNYNWGEATPQQLSMDMQACENLLVKLIDKLITNSKLPEGVEGE